MKRADWTFVVLVVGCGALIWSWPRPEPKSERDQQPFPRWHLDDGDAPRGKRQLGPALAFTLADLERDTAEQSRCGEGTRRRLYLFEDEKRVGEWPVADAVKLPGCVVLDTGRHKGQNGLPLAALLSSRKGDWDAMVIYPCRGEPMRLSVDELRKEPGRYVLVVAQRGMLKLLDSEESGSKPVKKNLAAIQLVK
ncbi:MAG: hypothetical protein V3T86_06770 [Planctomycetota bacterium]